MARREQLNSSAEIAMLKKEIDLKDQRISELMQFCAVRGRRRRRRERGERGK